MSAARDALSRKANNLEGQSEQLTAELTRLRDAIAAQMGEARAYDRRSRGGGQEMSRVRWEIKKELLLGA